MKSAKSPQLAAAVFIPHTPAGSLALAASPAGLAHLFFCARPDYDAFLAAHGLADGAPAGSLAAEAEAQVLAYFAGKRRAFDLPLDLAGQTPFRLKVLRVCAEIPFGQVLTYGQLAQKAGYPGAARAAGGTMAHNPIALVIPCHRVVGGDRGLHGFSSPGGLGTKATLLAHEGVAVDRERLKVAA